MNTRRAGFTLIEILMVMLIAGMVLAFALPRFGALRESGRMNAARTQMVSTVTTARSAAVQNGRPARWIRNGNQIQVVAMNAAGVFANVIPPVSFDAAYRVDLNSTMDTITYDARGMANVPTGRIYIRGARVDSVCVTRLGAVLLKGCL